MPRGISTPEEIDLILNGPRAKLETKISEREIELLRLRRMLADRNDFLTQKGLWKEFCGWRPNDEKKPKRDFIDYVCMLFKAKQGNLK